MPVSVCAASHVATGRMNVAIDPITADRAAAADRREAARVAARQYQLSQADARRDTRVEEAKAALANMPTPADRAVQTPSRPPQRLVDILV